MDYKNNKIDRNRQMVNRIQECVRQTSKKKSILGGAGDFASLYALEGYEKPVLVSGADGVGTKLKMALDFGFYDAIGQDLVAMCVNDVLCTGARPLFFLDYLACEHLDIEIATKLIESISQACAIIDIPLMGGDTAELPGFYINGLYNMGGFCVGVVEQREIRSWERAKVGDLIIGLSSNGLHSRGYSLASRVLADWQQAHGPLDYNRLLLNVVEAGKKSLKEILLQPTTIYAQLVGELLQSQWGQHIHSMAHITEGGICENLPRSFCTCQQAKIERASIHTPDIFFFIQNPGQFLGIETENMVSDNEMWQTFNMGLGFALIVAKEAAEGILRFCEKQNSWGQELSFGEARIEASIIGRICNYDNFDLPRVEIQ